MGVTSSGYRRGARAVAPLAIAIGALGVVFGYLARDAGLSREAAVVMSATTFAGSPQFAALTVFSAGGTIVAAIAAAAALAMRFGAMSATAAPSLRGPLWKRVLLSQLVVDETWAVAQSGAHGFDRELLIGAGLTLYAVHVASTALGATVGNFVGRPETWGVDATAAPLAVARARVSDVAGAVHRIDGAATRQPPRMADSNSRGGRNARGHSIHRTRRPDSGCYRDHCGDRFSDADEYSRCKSPMTRSWLLALVTGTVTMAIKSVGAFMPTRSDSSAFGRATKKLTPLLLPGVLTALIVVQAFSEGHRLVLDARAIGLIIALLSVKLRAPPAVTLVCAAAGTALARLIYSHVTASAI